MKFKFVVIFLVALFVLTGCKDDKNAVEPGPSKQPANAEEENNEEPEEVKRDPYTYPLTGVGSVDEPTLRPIAIMVNNHPNARPQSGISKADIVYEMLVEGEATRLLAIFQSNIPETIGPVRSARDYFIQVAKGYDALYIAHGYSPKAQQLLNSGVVDNFNGMQHDGTYFFRSKNRKAPHNSYITAENIERATDKLKISLKNDKNFDLTFYANEDNVKMGNEAKKIHMNYFSQNSSYSSIYTYDSESKKYFKSSPQEKIMDELVDEQVAISNVLFFETAHKVIDTEGRRDITLTGGGTAYVFQHGQMREVKWKNDNGLVYAVEQDGSKVPLVPGNTWIHFVPSSPGLSVSVNYSE
jgi:hypothetical protein